MTGNSSESTVSTCESMASAENVALSLLGHFSQLHLPHESDMEWLVSEKDAPQHVLLFNLFIKIIQLFIYRFFFSAAADAQELASESGRTFHAAEGERDRRRPDDVTEGQRRVGPSTSANCIRCLFIPQVKLYLTELLINRAIFFF